MINKFNVLNGAKYFSSGIFQNYLVLQQAKNHHLLPDMNFNGHCLIKNNISIPKKRNIQKSNFWDTRSSIKVFKDRFYIR